MGTAVLTGIAVSTHAGRVHKPRASRSAFDLNTQDRFRGGRSQRRAKGYQQTFSVLAYEALKADPTALIKELSSKGLLKYATAPAFSARSRPSGNAVTKMTGVQYPFCSKCCCKSSPFSPGICKSVMRQTVLPT